MKKSLVFGLSVLAVSLFVGCAKNGGKTVVLQVGKDKTTFATLERRFSEAPATLQGYLTTESGRKQFMDLIVRERVVVEASKQAGYDRSKEYKEAVKNFDEEQAKQAQEYKENILVELFVKDLQRKNLNVTDEELKKYYDDHIAEFKRPLEIKARHILLSSKEDAQKALDKLKHGADFAKLAKEVSIDPISANRGGEIGPFTRGDLIPEFEKAVFPMKIGEISPITETQFGFHIITKITEKVLPARSFEDSKEEVKKLLEKAKFDAWLELTKNKFGTKIDYSVLTKLSARAQALPRQDNRQAERSKAAKR